MQAIRSAKCKRVGVPVGVPAACKDLGSESCNRDDIHPVFSVLWENTEHFLGKYRTFFGKIQKMFWENIDPFKKG